MRFECERVEAWSEDDTLEAVGVRWTEPHKFVEGVLAAAGGLSLVGGFLGLFTLAPVGVAATITGLGMLAGAIFMPGRAREIVFYRDGSMLTPLGLSTNFLWPGQKWLDHTGIKSIETEQLVFPTGDDRPVYTHGVRIFYVCGEMNHVAKNLMADDAHMLAVRLNQALKRLRESLGRPVLLGQTSAAEGGQGRRVID